MPKVRSGVPVHFSGVSVHIRYCPLLNKLYRYTFKLYRYTLATACFRASCTGTHLGCTGTLFFKLIFFCSIFFLNIYIYIYIFSLWNSGVDLQFGLSTTFHPGFHCMFTFALSQITQIDCIHRIGHWNSF